MSNDSWVYQGRQYHQWFGNGTKPGDDEADGSDADAATDDLFAPANADQRIAYVAHAVIGHLPQSARGHASAAPNRSALDQLQRTMPAWYGARSLSRDAFRQRFLDPATSDATVDCLRGAACGAIEAHTPEALGAAGGELAGAMQQIGLDRWSRYLAAAGDRVGAAGESAGQPYQVAQLDRPDVKSDASPPTGAPSPTGETPAQRLKAAEEAAYDLSPRDCSHAVWELLKRTGSPDEPYRTANDFMTMVTRHGSGWRQVTVEEASRLANDGKVVIGGLPVPGGNGHILAVMPGSWRPAGGFVSNGKQIMLTPEQYPLAMSGSSNDSWAGSHSRGEKTVYDAWSKADYPAVTFWTRQ